MGCAWKIEAALAMAAALQAPVAMAAGPAVAAGGEARAQTRQARAPDRQLANRSEPTAAGQPWILIGQLLTAAGAGTLSAVGTPLVVRSLQVMASDWATRFNHHDAGQLDGVVLLSSLVGGGVSLALGAAIWRRGSKLRRRQLLRSGQRRPTVRRSPAMHTAGITLTATGAGLGGVAVALAFVPGNCEDSNPPVCSYPYRSVGIVSAIVGLTAVGVGVPLWLSSDERVAAGGSPRALLAIGPDTVGVDARF